MSRTCVDAPVISCRPTYAFLGAKSAYVGCEVRAKPLVSAVFWILDVNGTTVTEGDVINEYWTLVMVSSLGQFRRRLPVQDRLTQMLKCLNIPAYFLCRRLVYD